MYELIKRAVIEIESNCNFNCQFCVQKNKEDSRISFDEYKQIIDECCELGLETVQLEGSGEATLREDLPDFISYAADKGVKVNIYSNGFLMRGEFMKQCVDAGLSLFRFSINAPDRHRYFERTGNDYFDIIIRNVQTMEAYKPGIAKTYHIAFDKAEVWEYVDRVVNRTNVPAEIWKPHNWAGEIETTRTGKKRSCGRPFAPEITIRSDLDVYPCCQTFSKEAILGNVKDGVLKGFNSQEYTFLRVRHRAEQWPTYCNECDFLLNDNSVLLWSNCDQQIGKMNNVEVNLDISD